MYVTLPIFNSVLHNILLDERTPHPKASSLAETVDSSSATNHVALCLTNYYVLVTVTSS